MLLCSTEDSAPILQAEVKDMEAFEKDAKESLKDIESVARKTRRVAEYAGTDVVLIAWGIVWMLGYLGSQFIPMMVRPALYPQLGWMISGWWGLLVTGGIIVTIKTYSAHSPTMSAEGRRLGLLWPIMFGYVYLMGFLIGPFIHVSGHEESMRFYRHMGAIAGIIPMLIYVIIGLWLDSFLTWVGLGITVLIVVGLVLFRTFFWLWMAFVCGGGLIATGVFIRRKWRAE